MANTHSTDGESQLFGSRRRHEFVGGDGPFSCSIVCGRISGHAIHFTVEEIDLRTRARIEGETVRMEADDQEC